MGEATQTVGLAFGDVILAAWRGDEARADAVFEALHARAGRLEVVAELYARTVLNNGLGRYEAALDAGLRAVEQERSGSYLVWQMGPELIEAAVRAGRSEAAAGALERIVERARASGTDPAIGSELQARALLAADDDADALFSEAIDRLRRSGAEVYVARAQLVYGEWLRRRQRRTEAHTHLRDAHTALSAIGAHSFAERARRELEATGEHPRKRSVDLMDELTAQEVHIARHVAAGATPRRSPPSCSCPRGRSTPTCATSSASSASPRDASCAACRSDPARAPQTTTTLGARAPRGRGIGWG